MAEHLENILNTIAEKFDLSFHTEEREETEEEEGRHHTSINPENVLASTQTSQLNQ